MVEVVTERARRIQPRPMCIAAACRHKGKKTIVLCTDSRSERGLALSELRIGSDDADKVRDMWGFTALLAGHPTSADELLTQCDDAVSKFSNTVPNEDTDIVITSFFEDLRAAARSRKRKMVEHYIGMTTNFKDFDDFVNTD